MTASDSQWTPERFEALADMYDPRGIGVVTLALRAAAAITRERDQLLAFKRGVDEALNQGDGSYRP